MKFGQGLLNDREESGRGGKDTRKHSGRGMEGNEDAPSFLPDVPNKRLERADAFSEAEAHRCYLART
jgi:hypothetical protein